MPLVTRRQFSDPVSTTQPALQFSDWWHSRGGNRAAALLASYHSIARPRVRLSAAVRVSLSLLVLVRLQWGMSKPNEGPSTSNKGGWNCKLQLTLKVRLEIHMDIHIIPCARSLSALQMLSGLHSKTNSTHVLGVWASVSFTSDLHVDMPLMRQGSE